MFLNLFLIFISLSTQAAETPQPGVWNLVDKSNGPTKTLEIIVDQPLTMSKLVGVTVSVPSVIDIAALKILNPKILVLFVRDSKTLEPGGGSGFVRHYFSILKLGASKISLGATKFSGKEILPNPIPGEVATLTRD